MRIADGQVERSWRELDWREFSERMLFALGGRRREGLNKKEKSNFEQCDPKFRKSATVTSD